MLLHCLQGRQLGLKPAQLMFMTCIGQHAIAVQEVMAPDCKVLNKRREMERYGTIHPKGPRNSIPAVQAL